MTTRRYRIVHTTRLAYGGAIQSSHNELRMTPVTEPGQTTLESRIRVKPLSWSHLYKDHWGTLVTAIEALDPHDVLDITSISTVERFALPDPRQHLTWEELAEPVLRDLSFEWLMPTAHTHLDESVHDRVGAATSGLSPADAVARVVDLVRDRVTYEQGVTGVHSSAQDAWDAGSGVCQDYAHLVIGALREIGVPCRYVSGYLCPTVDSAVGDSATAESHAWVEWWDGAWIPVDPTSPDADRIDHVVVGRGRDYDDVPPIKGVYRGADAAGQTVRVTFTRLA